jgi:hypothetical protein
MLMFCLIVFFSISFSFLDMCLCNLISSYFAACDCSTCGTKECDSHTGLCQCHDNVVGEKCDRCQVEHYGFNACQVCDCDKYGIY